MKSFFLVFFVSFFSALSSLCYSQELRADSYQRTWMLVQFDHYSREELIEKRASLDLKPYDPAQNFFVALMGCKPIPLSAKLHQNGKARFRILKKNTKPCPEKSPLDTDFRKAIKKVKRFGIEGHFLHLYDRKGNQMKFVAQDWD